MPSQGGKTCAASTFETQFRKPLSVMRKPKPPALRYSPAPLLAGEATLAEAAAALHALDPETIGHLVEIGGPPPLRRREPGFAGLAAIVLSQQVSVASASAIFKRLETRLAPLEARTVSEATDEALRECGLSTAKVRALRALAKAIVEDGLDL